MFELLNLYSTNLVNYMGLSAYAVSIAADLGIASTTATIILSVAIPVSLAIGFATIYSFRNEINDYFSDLFNSLFSNSSNNNLVNHKQGSKKQAFTEHLEVNE